jgi:DNA-binding CsgD family transcriptional regulator
VSAQLLGRAHELEEIDLLLDAVASGLRSLALTGPAGIGKTTVWQEACRRAAARGYRVLAAEPARAERSLSYAGMSDLLAELPKDLYESLAPLQRHALEVAVLGAEPDPELLGPRGMAAGCLAALRLLATEGPVLLAVDDAQWLDTETAESLAFAIRRLGQTPVGVLVSVRIDQDRPATFETALPIDRRRDVLLGPLSLAVLEGIIKREIRQSLARPTLVRVAGMCQGNPFYAVEIARELARVGIPKGAAPLPVPSELQGLLRSRMSRLPAETREALLVAACASQPTTAFVDLESIGPAEEAGIVAVADDGRVRFTHPLLAAAVVASSSRARRRAVHLRLAETLDDAEERARHLASAATGPDERVAASLDEAAARVAARGGASAVDLGRQAIELTDPRDTEHLRRRVLCFAHYARFTSTHVPDLISRVEEALVDCPPGDMRAELLLARQNLAWVEGDSSSAFEATMEAVATATDRCVRARAHLAVVWSDESNPLRGLEHLEAALRLLDEGTEPLLYSTALMHHAYVRLIAGLGRDDEAVRRGREIEAAAAGPGWWERSPVPIIWPLLGDRLTEALHVHQDCLSWARRVGDAGLEHSMLSFLSQIELLRGDYAAAAHWCAELAELAEQNGAETWRRRVLVDEGTLDAHAGRLATAQAKGEEALDLAQQDGRSPGAELAPRQLLGLVALCRRDYPAVAGHLLLAASILSDLGQREPAQWRFQPDLVEALLASGDLDEAEEAVRALEARSVAIPRPWTAAVSVRCRGQLWAARGELDQAADSLARALARHGDLEMPYELGRTLLAQGQVLRRRSERRAARTALERAIEVFEGAGSIVWADRAREELKRVPVRRRREELTATEDTVARLAVAGLTNKQIAERAFLSPKTVEGNLTRIYLKLGVHSRAELVRAFAGLGGTAPSRQ